MDGVHDLAGMQGFGPVEPEADEPVFHEEWERRAWGLTMGTFVAGISNGGQFRHSIERMDPAHYLTSPYYEHWVTGVATRLVETGVVTADELDDRAGGSFPISRPVAADATPPSPTHNRFNVGDRVRVSRTPTSGHTRCPRYVRGKAGVVVRVDPAASVPDVEAHQPDERVSEPVYCVRFDAADLWGGADVHAVHVDLWQRYLEPA
jgi:nitrile hydratase beta subunit